MCVCEQGHQLHDTSISSSADVQSIACLLRNKNTAAAKTGRSIKSSNPRTRSHSTSTLEGGADKKEETQQKSYREKKYIDLCRHHHTHGTTSPGSSSVTKAKCIQGIATRSGESFNCDRRTDEKRCWWVVEVFTLSIYVFILRVEGEGGAE